MLLVPFVLRAEEPVALAPDDLSLVALLDTQVVTAARMEQSLAEAVAVIDVITAEQIRERGYANVAEALASVAGIDPRYDQYQHDLGVRGVSGGIRGWSRSVKVMIDGQPVSFRPSGENFLGAELVPLGAVARIEVLRGPASVLYGANAFLGVVNIITKEGYALDGNEIAVFYEGGPKIDRPWGRAMIGQTFGDFELLLAAEGETREQDGYRLVTLPGRTHPRSEETSETLGTLSASALGRLTYEHDTLGTWSLDGHLQRLDRSAEFVDWGVMSHDSQIQLYNGYGRLRYHSDEDHPLVIHASAALSSGGPGLNDHLNTAPDLDTFIRRDVGYTGYDFTLLASYALDARSTVMVGVDATLDQQTLLTHYTVYPPDREVRNPPADSPTGVRDFQNLGAYVHAVIHPFELLSAKAVSGGALRDLGVAAGLRVDTHNIYGDNWSSRAGLVYDIGGRHYAKLLYGSSYRAPSSTQLFSNYIQPQGVVGNPDLRAERARTFEIALGTTPAERLTLRLDGFLTFIDDRVEVQPAGTADRTGNPMPVNSTPITSSGFELQVDYSLENLALFGSASLQSSRYDEENVLSLEREIVAVPTGLYPTYQVKAGVTWTVPRWFLRTYLEGRLQGEVYGEVDNNALVNGIDYLTDYYTLDPYFLLDLTLSTVGIEPWEGHESRFVFKVRNLLDTEYVLPGSSGFDIPGIERSFQLGFEQDL